jgi:hypothetical protein
MENIVAETRVRTPMQSSIDGILSEKGLSDLFYNDYVTDFYLIIEDYSFLGVRLVLERSGNSLSVIYYAKISKRETLSLKYHHDIEMRYKMPSWEPIALEDHNFHLHQHCHSIENYFFSNLPETRKSELCEISRIWADNIRHQEWDKAIRYMFGYKIEGRWHRAKIRER